MRPQKPIYLFIWTALFTLGLLAAVSRLAPARAQEPTTVGQATIDALVNQTLTQAAQSGMPTANFTQTLEAAVLNARTATAAVPTPTLTPSFAAARLRLASFETYPLMASYPRSSAHLAPNGDIFVHIEDLTFCIYTAEGEETGCATLANVQFRGIEAETVRWSPDSRFLIFTNYFLITVEDSDIWLFDVETLTFSNLTDDGFEGSLIDADPVAVTFPFDEGPIWSPSGTEIAFIRYPITLPGLASIDDNALVQICFLTLLNRDLDCSEILPDARHFRGISTLDWSTRDVMAFTVSRRSPDDTTLPGLWVYDRALNEADHVVDETPERLLYHSVQFSPDGHYILVATPASASRYSQLRIAEASAFRVINLDTGNIEFVDPAQFVLAAGWLPNGGLFYLAQPDPLSIPPGGGAGYTELYANDAPNTQGRLLASSSDLDLNVGGGMLIAPTSYGVKPLIWSAQNSTLLTTNGPQTFLFRFELE